VQHQAGIALGQVGASLGQIQSSAGPNPFNVFDKFLDRVSQTCADAVEADPRFKDLGGIHIFTKSHCFTMQNSLRLE
jgi:hypothetical protein